MLKRDGHTHTEFCPHGSGERAEAMVRRAIDLGFTHYSFTEHAPAPKDFLTRVPESQKSIIETSHIPYEKTEAYLGEMLRLKKLYGKQIHISVGFELDYLEGYENWTREFLNKYGQWTDDGILSVHYLYLDGIYHPIDSDFNYTSNCLLPALGGYDAFCSAYYRTVMSSVKADLGPWGPKRIGHMSLCRKYRKKLELTRESGTDVTALINECLKLIKTRSFELDFNTAGLYKPLCDEFYPGDIIFNEAIKQGVPFVFGSDAHSVEQVGRSYEVYAGKSHPEKHGLGQLPHG